MSRTETVSVQGLPSMDVLRGNANTLIHRVKNMKLLWVGGEEDREGVGGQEEY